MDKFELAEKSLYEALDAAYAEIDAEVGRIKRDAKSFDSYSNSITVSDIASALIAAAGNLASTLQDLYANRSKPLVLRREKFDDQFQTNLENLFSMFAGYCYTVIEEVSVVTNQKHMYGKEYPALHQSLESIKSDLVRAVGQKNAQ